MCKHTIFLHYYNQIISPNLEESKKTKHAPSSKDSTPSESVDDKPKSKRQIDEEKPQENEAQSRLEQLKKKREDAAKQKVSSLFVTFIFKKILNYPFYYFIFNCSIFLLLPICYMQECVL